MKWEAPIVFRRQRVGWRTALAVAGAGGALVVAGLWVVRAPLTEFAVKSMLSGQGVESDFQIINLDFGGALLRDVRLGDEANPDARIARVEVGFGWRGLAPYLRAIRVVDPHLNLRMDE